MKAANKRGPPLLISKSRSGTDTRPVSHRLRWETFEKRSLFSTRCVIFRFYRICVHAAEKPREFSQILLDRNRATAYP